MIVGRHASRGAWRRVALASFPALALALIVACGGDKSPDEGPISDTPVATVAPASDAEALLSEVASSMEDVTSLSGTFRMEGSTGGVPLDIEASMVIRQPDAMHMEMDVFGQHIEVLVFGAKFYVNIPEQAWHLADLAELGFSASTFEDLFENKGAVDMDALLNSATAISQLEDESIDGASYRRIRVTGDYARMTEGVAGSLLTGEAAEIAENTEGDLQSDWWIDEATARPRRIVMAMELETPVGPSDMTITMDFEEFDGEVEIPAEPVDAPPLSDLR